MLAKSQVLRLHQAIRTFSDLALRVKVDFPNGNSYEQPTGLFIDGQFVRSRQGKTFEVINPSTEEEITHVYEAREDDVEIAVSAAKKAFPSWAADPEQRVRCLNKLADLVEEHAETLAHIESLDNGKSLQCSRGDVQLVSKYLRSCGGWADKINGTVIETGTSHFTYTRKEPLGVCGQIIPWNFPLLMWSWKIGPALATGNTVVLKPAESTPLSALYACDLVNQAGIPKGVVNIVPGFGKIVGEKLCQHPDIKKIAFTGSTATGRHIMKMCSDTVKKVTLELGGKSPNIVFADANIDLAVKNLSAGIFYNSGEVCCAGSRIYVQDKVYDEVVEKFKTAAEKLKVGNPFDESTYQGAQTSQMQLDKILGYVKIATEEGARVVTGGERLGNKGYFVKPTIFADIKEDMRVVKEEVFGPLVTISKFSTVDEVVEMANNSIYGLAAGIHSRDINKVISVAHRIKAGSVWINTYNDFHQNVPFGGFGQSGIGSEMGEQALENYTQTKAIRVGLENIQA